MIHCLGTGLVGSWVAKRLAAVGHEVHAYDIHPHRVLGIDGITAHHCDVIEEIVHLHELSLIHI